MNAHVLVGDTEIVVTVDGREVSLPIGVRSLSFGLAADPPRPEELINAIGWVADHLDDIVRDHPDVIGGDISITGAEVTAMVAVEQGAAAVLPFTFSRTAAEEVFRTLVTECRAERMLNPGLDRALVDSVVAGSCAVVAVMRRLQIESVAVQP